MAEATYRLEKVNIGGKFYILRVDVDAESIRVDYDGKNVPLSSALEDIRNMLAEIKEVKKLDIATDEEVGEMLEEIFGPAEAPDNVATDEEIGEMLDEVFGFHE